MTRSARAGVKALGLVVVLVAGPIVGLALVAAVAPLVSRPERDILGNWLPLSTSPGRSLLGSLGATPTSHSVLTASLLALVLTWLAMVILIHNDRLPAAVSRSALVLWIAPFALAPPVLSRDAYAYAAQGQLLVEGIDPYRHPVAALGAHSAVLSSVDPLWRHTLTPYGPLALRVQQAAVWATGGDERLVLIALRLMAMIALGITAVMLRRCAPEHRRELTTWLLFSPLVLLHLVGGVHLESIMCPLLVASVLLVQRRRPLLGGIASGLALDIKSTAAVMVLALLVHLGARAEIRKLCWVLGGAGLAVLSSVALLPSDPFGWLRAMRATAQTHTPAAPAATAYQLLSDALARAHAGVPDGLLGVVHAAFAVGGVLISGAVIWKFRTRSFPWMAGVVSLLLLLSSPVLWPWYLAPSALVLLAAPSSLLWLAILGSVPALLAVPLRLEASQRLGLIGELLAACAWLRWHRRPAGQDADPNSAAAACCPSRTA